MKNIKHIFSFTIIVAITFFLVACSEESSNGSGDDKASAKDIDVSNYPDKSETLNFLIAFDPGGGNDIFSRAIIEAMQKNDLYPGNVVPENMGGGSGAIGYSFFKNTGTGDPYYLTSTSGNFITTPLVSETEYDYNSFTSVGLLASETPLLVVNADSEYETIDDFVEAAKEKELSVGGSGAYGPDRVVAGLLEESADISLNFIPFDSASEGVTGVLSGSLDAQILKLSEGLGQIDSGDLRPLAYSAEEREFEELPDLPTFKESGYDFVFTIPRGIYLPADVPEEVRDWWIETLKEVEKTDEWQSYLKNNMLNSNSIYGDEFDEFMDETVEDFERVLKKAGVLE